MQRCFLVSRFCRRHRQVGVDKTRNAEHFGTCRNIPEHSGTSRNIPEHEKIKIIFMEKKIKNKIIFVKINNNVK